MNVYGSLAGPRRAPSDVLVVDRYGISDQRL